MSCEATTNAHVNNQTNTKLKQPVEIAAGAAAVVMANSANSNTSNYVNQPLLLLNNTTSQKNNKYPSNLPLTQTNGKTSKLHTIKMLPQYLLNNSKIKQLISHNNNNKNVHLGGRRGDGGGGGGMNGANNIHLSTPDLYNASVSGE